MEMQIFYPYTRSYIQELRYHQIPTSEESIETCQQAIRTFEEKRKAINQALISQDKLIEEWDIKNRNQYPRLSKEEWKALNEEDRDRVTKEIRLFMRAYKKNRKTFIDSLEKIPTLTTPSIIDSYRFSLSLLEEAMKSLIDKGSYTCETENPRFLSWMKDFGYIVINLRGTIVITL